MSIPKTKKQLDRHLAKVKRAHRDGTCPCGDHWLKKKRKRK